MTTISIVAKGDADLQSITTVDSRRSSSLFSEIPFEELERIIRNELKSAKLIPECTVPKISRAHGGMNNRITFVDCTHANGDKYSYVWRTPRHDGIDVSQTAKMMLYVRRFTKIPVPKVESYASEDADLSKRYIFMRRVPGIDLYSVLLDAQTSIYRRIRLAEEVAKVYGFIAKTHVIGEIGQVGMGYVEWDDLHHSASQRGSGVRLETFAERTFQSATPRLMIRSFTRNPLDLDESDTHTGPLSLRQYMLNTFASQLLEAKLNGWMQMADAYTRIQIACKALMDPQHNPIVGEAVPPVLLHTDLFARNIVVEIGETTENLVIPSVNSKSLPSGTSKHSISVTPEVDTTVSVLKHDEDSNDLVRISAVLDWDRVEAWPPVVAYRSPNWLWMSSTPGPAATGSTSFDDEAEDFDPDYGLADLDHGDLQVRAKFIDVIEEMIPGYMNIVRTSCKFGVKILVRLLLLDGYIERHHEGDIARLEALAKQVSTEGAIHR